MENLDISTLLDNDIPTINKIESLIGRNKEITSEVIDHLKANMPINTSLLEICALLLLERRNCVIEVIQNILKFNLNLSYNFLKNLQKSKFYNQRMAIPKIICKLKFNGQSEILKKCFEDDNGLVIQEAVLSLSEYTTIPFNDDELLEIASNLNNHQFDFVQCQVARLLPFINQKSFLISEVCMSKSWRKRLSMARLIDTFCMSDRKLILQNLCNDLEPSVRLALIEKIHCIENVKDYVSCFLVDSNEKVRAATVREIGKMNDCLQFFDEVVKDSSWVVRKELLCIHNENVYEQISLPIIKTLPKKLDWRVKIEILDTIDHIVSNNDCLVQRCLVDTLTEYLRDRVFEVRKRACEIFARLVQKADWSESLVEVIENLLSKSSYFVRVTLTEVCLILDAKHNTLYVNRLLQDPVINVRHKMLTLLNKDSLTEDILNILQNMEGDEYINREKTRLMSK